MKLKLAQQRSNNNNPNPGPSGLVSSINGSIPQSQTSKMFDVQQMMPNDFDDDIQAKDIHVRNNRKRQAQKNEDEPVQAQIPGGVYERPKGIERDPTTECGSLGEMNPSGQLTENQFKELTQSSRNVIQADLTP